MTLDLLIENLTVRSPRGRRLLDIPELALPQGAALGIKGASGAGKSTLLQALSGLIPAEGRVHWGDTDILSLKDAESARFRAAHMGMVFQDFMLFDELTARRNAEIAALFAPRAARAKLRKSAADHLASLGLSEDWRQINSYSGGERQRVAIARALAGSPAILLADEPTAALDRKAADRLIADLVSLAKSDGKTLITVSHDQNLLDRMDRVITLEDGLILEDASA